MTLARYYLALLIAIAVLSLAACRESDVPPGNTSNVVLEDGIAAGAASEPPDAHAVREEDIMPPEFQRAGAAPPDRIAFVTLQPTDGNTASGMAAFIQPDANDPTVRVVGAIEGIAAGTHGMHIHETGDCRAPDASSAGEHYDPTGTGVHGDRASPVRHLGDLGNITAGADQVARFDFEDEQLALVGANSIVRKALIVHAGADDLATQPGGDSGSRIACGVITPQENILVPE